MSERLEYESTNTELGGWRCRKMKQGSKLFVIKEVFYSNLSVSSQNGKRSKSSQFFRQEGLVQSDDVIVIIIGRGSSCTRLVPS